VMPRPTAARAPSPSPSPSPSLASSPAARTPAPSALRTPASTSVAAASPFLPSPAFFLPPLSPLPPSPMADAPFSAVVGSGGAGGGRVPHTIQVPDAPQYPLTPPRPAAVPSAPSASTCSCRASECLKLYCPCFASSGLCTAGCMCKNCKNSAVTPDDLLVARQAALARDARAFEPRVRPLAASPAARWPPSARNTPAAGAPGVAGPAPAAAAVAAGGAIARAAQGGASSALAAAAAATAEGAAGRPALVSAVATGGATAAGGLGAADAARGMVSAGARIRAAQLEAGGGADGGSGDVRRTHSKGCHCRRGCEKKYCVCREAGVPCGPRCGCTGPTGCLNGKIGGDTPCGQAKGDRRAAKLLAEAGTPDGTGVHGKFDVPPGRVAETELAEQAAPASLQQQQYQLELQRQQQQYVNRDGQRAAPVLHYHAQQSRQQHYRRQQEPKQHQPRHQASAPAAHAATYANPGNSGPTGHSHALVARRGPAGAAGPASTPCLTAGRAGTNSPSPPRRKKTRRRIARTPAGASSATGKPATHDEQLQEQLSVFPPSRTTNPHAVDASSTLYGMPAVPAAAAAAFAFQAVPPPVAVSALFQNLPASPSAFSTPVGTRPHGTSLLPPLSLPSSANIRAAVEAMDRPAAMFGLAHDGVVADGDADPFMDVLLSAPCVQLPADDLAASVLRGVDGGGQTPSAAHARLRDDKADLITPVTGYPRGGAVDHRPGSDTRSHFSPPVALRHSTPMTEVRAAGRAFAAYEQVLDDDAYHLFPDEPLVEVDTRDGTPVTKADAANYGAGAAAAERKVPMISQATRNHLSTWAAPSPVPHGKPSRADGDLRPVRRLQAHGHFTFAPERPPPGGDGDENVPPAKRAKGAGAATHAAAATAAAAMDIGTNWQALVQPGGKIEVPQGDVGVSRAPRIFRFRVGSGDRVQPDGPLRERSANPTPPT
jgi:hypothetical protein